MVRNRDKFTPEIKQFIRETASEKLTYNELYAAVEERFHSGLTRKTIEEFMCRENLPKKKLKPPGLFNEEQEAYIRTIIPGRSSQEIADLMKEKFGMELTKWQIKTWKNNHHCPCGRDTKFRKGRECMTKGRSWDEWMPPESQERSRSTQFKSGHMPHNHVPVGTITVRERWLWLKISDNRNRHDWVALHRYIWEQTHGPIPEGMVVSFKDNNNFNCDPDNLILVRKESIPIIHFEMGLTDDAEINETIFAAAELLSRIRGLEHAKGSV